MVSFCICSIQPLQCTPVLYCTLQVYRTYFLPIIDHYLGDLLLVCLHQHLRGVNGVTQLLDLVLSPLLDLLDLLDLVLSPLLIPLADHLENVIVNY